MSLSRKVFRSSTLNLVEHFVQLAVVFFVTPLMIRHLGETQYGIWLLCMVIVGYYKLLDLGTTMAGVRFLARSIGADDAEDYQVNISTLLTLYIRIGLLTIPLTVVVAFTAPHFINHEGFADSIRWVLLAFGLNVSIRFFTRIFTVILRSHIRHEFIVTASLSKTLIQGGLMIYFLQHGATLTTLITIHIGADLIDQLLLIVFSKRIDSKTKLNTQRYQPKRARELLRFGYTAFLGSAGTSLRLGFDPMIIGAINGVALVPIYSIGNRLLSIFTDIVGTVFGGSHQLAALCQIDARPGANDICESFLKMIRLCSAFSMLAGCALAIYGPPFITRWIGSGFEDSATILLILIIPFTLMSAQYPVWGLFFSTNRHRYIVYIGIIGGSFNLILSVILAYTIGFFGVIWGTFIDISLVSLIVVPLFVHRTIKVSVIHYVRTLIPSFFKAGIPSLIWYFTIKHLITPDYTRLFVLAAAHAFLVFGILWFTVLNKKERSLLLTMFRPAH
jgi:O-antigen/teichoic acid export membrane protein